jgi:hypothetical protein
VSRALLDRGRLRFLVRCLGFLRQVLDDVWVGVLEPFPVHPLDADDVGRAVVRMAGHVGLQGLRFDVSFGRLEPGTGAEIALQRGQARVPIRVSGAAASFPPTLLALLAHELCHKVLFDRGIVLEGTDLASYEVLTEVTAVFLGMGKLLLNGYEFVVTERDWDRLLEVRHQHRFGYVTVDEVAFMHAMLCRLRAVPEVDARHGLSRFALAALARVASDPAIRVHLARAQRIAPRASYV